jgi:hypothetical protein
MQVHTKAKFFWALAGLLGLAALLFAAFGVILIHAGAYPPEGTGSLGHVGTTIAGIIAAFLALVLSLFTVMCISKARSARRAGDL